MPEIDCSCTCIFCREVHNICNTNTLTAYDIEHDLSINSSCSYLQKFHVAKYMEGQVNSWINSHFNWINFISFWKHFQIFLTWHWFLDFFHLLSLEIHCWLIFKFSVKVQVAGSCWWWKTVFAVCLLVPLSHNFIV